MYAPEAELAIATTLDDRDDLAQHPRGSLCRLDGILAVRMGTPSKAWVVVDVGAIEKFAISAWD